MGVEVAEKVDDQGELGRRCKVQKGRLGKTTMVEWGNENQNNTGMLSYWLNISMWISGWKFSVVHTRAGPLGSRNKALASFMIKRQPKTNTCTGPFGAVGLWLGKITFSIKIMRPLCTKKSSSSVSASVRHMRSDLLDH
nr:hypothetical protein Iba_chr09cCG9080 [Ipomoea batatas]